MSSWASSGPLRIRVAPRVNKAPRTKSSDIQHFPDSPHRSLWVVPTGFVLSLVALYMLEGREKLGTRSFVIYALIGTALVIGGCIGAMEIIEHLGMTPHGHGH